MRGERRLLPDLVILAGGQVVAQSLNLAALVFLARRLGEHDFGLIQVGVAVAAYAMITAEWGLFSLGVRDIARFDSPTEIRTYARAHQGLLAGLAVIVMAAGLLVLPLLPFTSEDPALFRLYLLLVLPQVFLQEWIGTGLQRMPWVGAGKITTSLLYAGGVMLGLSHLDGLAGWPARRWVPVLYLVSFTLGGMLIAPAVARWLGGWVRPSRAGLAVWRRRLAEAAPLGASVVLLRLLISGDVLMLGILARPETAGVYAAAAKIGFLVVITMYVLWKALLPRLSRLARDGGPEGAPAFRARFQLLFALVVAGLLPLALAGVVAGPALMGWLYGAAYAAARDIFPVLAVSYLLLALGWFLGHSLLAVGRQQAFLPPLLIAATVAVLGLIGLIPRYGGLGGAWAMLLAHGTLCAVLLGVCRHWFSRALWPCAGLVACGAGLMGLVVVLAAPWGPWAAALLGTAVYAVVVVPSLRRVLRPLWG